MRRIQFSTPGTYQWRVTAKDEFSGTQPVTDGISAPIGTFTYAPRTAAITGPATGTHFSNPYGDEVSLETIDALKPAVVRSVESQDYLYLLMPVRVS